VAVHDETDAPVAGADDFDVVSGCGKVLAGPDSPEAAASV